MNEAPILTGIERHRRLLRKRGSPMSAENLPPTGQAAGWYRDVVIYVPRSGQRVARQLARLCGQDSSVTMPWRSLADAVGTRDKAGRTMAYAQSGVAVLVRAGWLEVSTVGAKRAARTTFRLMPGERADWLDLPDVEVYADAA